MLEIDIRPTVANDLSRLMGFDHSVTSESVWQLELRREPGQVNASFREVRLPRSISICLLNTSPSPRDGLLSRMPSSA